MRRVSITAIVALGLAPAAISMPARAQLMDILSAPKTLIERAAEARSTSDIAKDNAIVVKVDAAMARQGSISAATEIYEQRLLVTGLFSDKRKYDAFRRDVTAVEGIKTLYWQVIDLSEDDPKRKDRPSWADSLEMTTKAQVRLTKAVGGYYVNYRIATDSYGTLYVIGRAHTKQEAAEVVAALKDGDGVKKVTSHIDVRP